MNIEDSIRVLKTRKWIVQHRVPQDIIFQMEKITMTAPRILFERPIESALRHIYTQARRELKNG